MNDDERRHWEYVRINRLVDAAFYEVYNKQIERFNTYTDAVYVYDMILKRGPDPKYRKSKWPRLYAALIKIRITA